MKRVVWVLWIVLGMGTAVQGATSGLWLPLPDSARVSVRPFLPGPSDEVFVTVSGTRYGGQPDAVVGWADAKIEGDEIVLDVYWHPHPDTVWIAVAYPPNTMWSFEGTASLGTLDPGMYTLQVRNHGLVECAASTVFTVRSDWAAPSSWYPVIGPFPW